MNSFDKAVEEAIVRLEKSLFIYNENVLQNNRLLERLIQMQAVSKTPLQLEEIEPTDP